MLPLPYQLRPKSFSDFYGQEHIIGPEGNLSKLLESGILHSFILHGPPGTGKTSLASILANSLDAHFVELNATEAKIKDLRKHCEQAKERFRAYGKRTVIFVDEIHRFNKAQQDALLPSVEAGDIILIGATTENPSYEINAALLSRLTVYKLNLLAKEALQKILARALKTTYQNKVTLSQEVIDYLLTIAAGDARSLLTSLQLLIESKRYQTDINTVRQFLQKHAIRYDKRSDEHYNTISAFIKSVRGSDIDGSLIWLWKMIEAGEDPKFIFRRMLILASEDIGMADPQALIFVNNAFQAFINVGYPEGQFFLTHACIYLARAPKNNDVTRAMGKVSEYLKKYPTLQVPQHLTKEGNKEYRYPHDYPGHVVQQNYLPVNGPKENLYQE
ncbi:MAG: replication-associated recombination protein A [Candidatus Abawacabacteria bacterium]|nr:replication-associated recombination protein A [Candidatus Abawacabacteria bacterium]